MPCDASYMEPTYLERNLSEILGHLDFLAGVATKDFYKQALRGYHPNVNSTARPYQQTLDAATAKLCSILSSMSPEAIQKLPLEMQIWWRDHQEADKKRNERN